MEENYNNIIADVIQQDILDAINANDRIHDMVEAKMNMINDEINRHETICMDIDANISKAMNSGNYDSVDYLTLAKQTILSEDKRMVEVIKDYEKIIEELSRSNEYLHRIEGAVDGRL